MTQTDGSGSRSVVSTWGSTGHLVSAMVTNMAGYTLLGFHPSK